MKKKNLLVIMIAAMISVGLSSCSDDNEDGTMKVQYPIEITATNFPDTNFRKYLLKQDYGEDGILTEDEIKNITELEVSYNNISSLQGIEYFTALTKLNCGWNQLTSLDVSRNAALTLLYCPHNQLTSLDISRNTALKDLWCDENQLTSLDASKNTALTELDCYNNLLSTLDISKNTALIHMDCRHNQLTALDVSKITTLKELYCGDNPLASLDVSKNTALTKLDCYNNQLTSLDISKNTALIELTCYDNQIKGASMDNLINSLPISKKEYGPSQLEVCSWLLDEGNVCTKKHVQAAKEKGWIVLYSNGQEYEGSDGTPTNINGIRTEAGKDIPIYNLRGQRLTAPQKGVNIIGGRKVVVK